MQMSAETDERVIALSRVKLLLLDLAAVAFVLLGIWMTAESSSFTERSVGIVCALFFGLCGLYGLRKLFDSAPGLALSSTGILDNSSAAAVGFIPWSDVTGLSIYEMKHQKFLVVKVIDSQKYITAKGPLLRAMARASSRMCGSPVTISSNSLKIDFPELVKLMNVYWAKYGRTQA